MIGAPVPGVVNALQVTIPGRSPSVPSVKALGNARDEKRKKKLLKLFINSLDGALGHFLAGYYLSMHSMLLCMLF